MHRPRARATCPAEHLRPTSPDTTPSLPPALPPTRSRSGLSVTPSNVTTTTSPPHWESSEQRPPDSPPTWTSPSRTIPTEQLFRYRNNDNNESERALSMAKKISGCFQSDDGARAFATIRSYLATARKHNVGALEVLAQFDRGEAWMLL